MSPRFAEESDNYGKKIVQPDLMAVWKDLVIRV